MPIDPQAQAISDESSALGDIDFSKLPVDVIRKGIEAMDFSPPPEEVAQVEDRAIPSERGEVPVRIYRPAAEGKRPALVYLHGGGFVTGSVETHDALCRSLANRGRCVVLSVDYRLAPEHPYPAAPDDCYAAVGWVAENADRLGIDTARIAIGGDSAGGNLSAVTAQLCRDRGGPALCHQLLLYPAVDLAAETPSMRENAEGYVLTRGMIEWFYEQYLADPAEREQPMASPLRAKDLAGLPPATVLTAEFDPLRDEGEDYARALQAAGVSTELIRYDGQIHGFVSWGGRIDRGREAVDELGAVLRKVFGESQQPARP